MGNDLHAGVDRTIPHLVVRTAEQKPAFQPQEAVSATLKLFACGLERDERQLLDGLVRVSLRRSPRLQVLDERDAGDADVILIGATDKAAAAWAQRQPWITGKAVIWINASGPVAAGHTVIKRPVQWSILPILLARALENGPRTVGANSHHGGLDSRQGVLDAHQGSLELRHGALESRHRPFQSQHAPLGAAPMEVHPRPGSRPILVVDDSLAIRNHLRSLLEAGGFAVSEADSVEAALQLLPKQAFDCILMDVLMPGLDGYEGCRQIKNLRRGDRALPVIMLTSKSSPFDRIRGKMAGCDAYLTKPVDPKQLGDVLAQQLQN